MNSILDHVSISLIYKIAMIVILDWSGCFKVWYTYDFYKLIYFMSMEKLIIIKNNILCCSYRRKK